MCGETRDRVDFGPLHQGPRNLIEAKVSRCFDEMVAIVSGRVDLDDPTTNVRDVAP